MPSLLRILIEPLTYAVLLESHLSIEGAGRLIALPHIQKKLFDLIFLTHRFQPEYKGTPCPPAAEILL